MDSLILVIKKKYVFKYLSMSFFTIAVTLPFVKTTNEESRPYCVFIKNITYEKEVIIKIDAPYHMSMDYDMNTLFFSHNAEGIIVNKTLILFEMAYLQLDSTRIVQIKEVVGGFAVAVDNINKEIYMGGDDGVYIFDWTNNKATNLNIVNDSIWQMFYRDGLYFTTHPKGEAYWYKNGYATNLSNVINKVMMIAVDEEGNIIFYNSTGLFGYKYGLKRYRIGYYPVTGFSADFYNKLYFSTSTAIYYIVGRKIKEMTKLEGINGLAIERNGNFIYSTDESIIRLKKSSNCTDPKVTVKPPKTSSIAPTYE